MPGYTGEGKIREISPELDPDTTIWAILYNYDIGGDAPKHRHTEWLMEHVVPQLCNPQVKITVKGEASRTGSDAFNMALSKRRVDAIIRYLRAHGPVNADILAWARGEEDARLAGEEDKTEDEMFRAVWVKVEHSAHRLVPVRFSRYFPLDIPNASMNDGFDKTADPPWILVRPEDGFRLLQVENAEGLTLVSNRKPVAEPQLLAGPTPGPVRINRSPQPFRIMAGILGDAEIQAVDAKGRIHARLQVSVLPRLTVSCAFHYISNPRYGTRTRQRGDEAAFLDMLNEIWGKQANIAFEQLPGNASQPPIKMDDDLGDEIQRGRDFDTVVAHADDNARFNVFFVREVETDEEGTRHNGVLTDTAEALTTLGQGRCVFEDNVDTVDVDIAHEAGHALTLDHNKPIPTTYNMLMNGTGKNQELSRFLPRVHVLQARAAVDRR
jgi:hypothetical protein